MTEHALVVENLGKTYENGSEALKGISLTVEEGDFFALLGPNGAGKSTLIGIVTSLVNKTQGTVTVFGKDLDRELAAAKSFIGLVPQEFNFNIWEQVQDIVINQAGYYGLRREQAVPRTEKYLKKLGLWEKRSEQARELSGGMKRRLMIARALVHEPRLLILDEPTAGVDIELRRSMWAFLTEINEQGTTIILTTHYLEEAESLCESIAIIDEGRIIEDTKMKVLLNKLNMETFVLDLAAPAPTTLEVPGYAVRNVDATTLEVDIYREQGINGVFAALADQGVEVTSLRNKFNRLEELFVRLTGSSNVGQAAPSGATTEASKEFEV